MRFSVPDMSCGHCVATIEKAIRAEDPEARIEAALETHRISVRSRLTPARVAEILAAAGYPARPID